MMSGCVQRSDAPGYYVLLLAEGRVRQIFPSELLPSGRAFSDLYGRQENLARALQKDVDLVVISNEDLSNFLQEYIQSTVIFDKLDREKE